MACKECAERREKVINAVLEGRIAAAAGHVAKGAAEMVGLKAKGEPIPEPEHEVLAEFEPRPVKKPRAKRS